MPIIAIIGKDESNKKPWGNWGLRALICLLIWLGRALDVYVVNVKGIPSSGAASLSIEVAACAIPFFGRRVGIDKSIPQKYLSLFSSTCPAAFGRDNISHIYCRAYAAAIDRINS